MDPQTGEILALANYPTYNPNVYNASPEEDLRNRGVQELYEPGSTFKLVTASAAIEEQAFRIDEPIDVSAGRIHIGSRKEISDVHASGVLSFTDVIVQSSNVGAIKIGLRLGPERLSRYVHRFGFGTRICPDVFGEPPGMVSDPGHWSDSTLASVSIGYEIGVTPLQMATAVSSIANGGLLVQPRVVRALRKGSSRTEVTPFEVGRTIAPETSAELVAIMEQVVERGTGTAAAVPGYTVAGKTGTAAKIVNGRLFQGRVPRVVCRVRAVAAARLRRDRRDRFTAPWRDLRRCRRRAGLQADRRGRAATLRRAADDQSRAAHRGHRVGRGTGSDDDADHGSRARVATVMWSPARRLCRTCEGWAPVTRFSGLRVSAWFRD